MFRTISGSTYEADPQNKKIRRLYGKLPSTDRQGLDGDWKTYHSLSEVVVGHPVIIVWELVVVSKEPVARSTVTSLIKEIVEESKLS